MKTFISIVFSIVTLAVGIVLVSGDASSQAVRTQAIANVNARVVAVNIPGASAISEVGTFLNNPVPPACAHPMPALFPSYTQPGAVLDPSRILVGSRSNFGAPLAFGVGSEGSFLSAGIVQPAVVAILPHADDRSRVQVMGRVGCSRCRRSDLRAKHPSVVRTRAAGSVGR